jgi:hypothetical protein
MSGSKKHFRESKGGMRHRGCWGRAAEIGQETEQKTDGRLRGSHAAFWGENLLD